MYKIYALIDPQTQVVRYVGSTKGRISNRIAAHIHKSRQIPETELAKWVNSLVSQGLRPEYLLLGVSDSRSGEKAWIESLADTLLNINWKPKPC